MIFSQHKKNVSALKSSVIVAGFMSLAMGAACPAAAQGSMLEEIMVQAQKRSESIQDIGITVSAFAGDRLQELGVTDIANVAANIPNVQINYGFGQNAFNIRGLGINEFAANFDSPVAVHVDEVYISKNFMNGLMLFDVARVEALKGPQGTLFGRNTTGGAVNFYTNKPEEELSAGAILRYGNYQTFSGEAFINAPIADGVAGRLSGFIENQSEGFYDSLTTGEDEGRNKKWALRGQLGWEGERTKALLNVHYGEDNSELPPYEGVGIFTPDSFAAGAPVLCAEYLNGSVTGATANCVRGTDGGIPGDDDPFTANNNLTHKANNSGFGTSLRIDHEFNFATLTSITAYEQFERDAREDSDASPLQTIEVFWYNEIKQYSQELRLTSNGSGPWNYVAGAYFQHDDFRNGDYLTVGGGAAPGFFTDFEQKTDTVALFLHNDVELTETLSLVAGARYTWEEIRIDGGTSAGTGLIAMDGIEMPDTIVVDLAVSDNILGGDSNSDEAMTFKVGLEWKPEVSGDALDDLLVFGNVTTGFRSGGFNASFAGSQEAFSSLDSENLTAYEIGFKSTWFGQTLRVNGALFRYDFTDGQVNVDSPVAPVPIAVNAADIETLGAELDMQWRPLEGLDFTAGIGWLDAEIKSDISNAGQSLQGNRPVNSPKWTFNTSARYEAAISGDIRGAVMLDASWRGEQFLETVNAPSNLEDGYWLVNARASVFSDDDRWNVALYAKNLTDTEYRSYVNDLPGFGWLLNLYGPPRTFGVAVEFNY